MPKRAYERITPALTTQPVSRENVMNTTLSIAALAAIFCAAPAAAQSPAHSRQVVSYADLDLRNPAGISELKRRVRAAVREGCGAASDADLEGRNRVRRCRDIATQLASTKLERAIATARRSSSTVLASGR
jgi:UrcA family protein